MSSLFATRKKKARRVGREDDEEENDDHQGPEPVVKRPQSSKTKQNSKLRLSFGPGETSTGEDGTEASEVITPKKPGLGRRALENSALQRSWTPPGSSEKLPLRMGQDQDRPSYSQDYLQDLKNSTPSTPKTASEDEAHSKSIDIAAKFGEIVPTSFARSIIPSDAEIREKKERRARLAKEQDFISLNDGDNGNDEEDEWSLEPRKEEVETRLVRDDEDFAEGFDEYVEDGKISLGRQAEKQQFQKQRAQMRELINEAEDSSDEDDSDAERRAAYEASQTRAAMDGLGADHNEAPTRPKTPPKMTALPRLGTSLENLRLTLAAMQNSKSLLVQRMDDLRKEKSEIAVREVEIQSLLKEAGEKYERLKIEAGIGADGEQPESEVQAHRGLENFGGPALLEAGKVSNED